MTDQQRPGVSPGRPSDEPEPAAHGDSVAQFFAQQRAEVRQEPAGEVTWQRIVRSSRSTSRRRSRVLALTSAAVAVLALFAIWSWQREPMGGSGVRQGQAIAGNTDTVPSGRSSGEGRTVSPAQQPFKVPETFTTWSVSNAGHGTLYALGSQGCRGTVCPVLLRSGTNGTSWTAVHNFDSTDVSSATGTDVQQIQPDRAVTQVRFASPTTGYVFGGDLWVTRDSGASFSKLPHPGSTVLDVEVFDQQVVALSSDNCAQGVCNGPMYVSVFAPSATSVEQPAAVYSPDTPVRGGEVTVQNAQAFVQLSVGDSASAIPPMRLTGGRLQPMAPPAACNGRQLQSVTPATNVTGPVLLFAVCDPQESGSATSYTLVRSRDGGQHWESVSVGSLSLPRLGQVWLAAADDKHLVASAGGPRDTSGVPANSGAGSLVVSRDGGNGWAPADNTSKQPVPSSGFDWTASAGAGYFYAVPRTTSSFWATSDYGTRWRLVNPPA
ncbi:hypothetical protein HJ588_11375 [Flexivirga sp. ID2601S]|uniref:Exo-alpha-sialidase n=1 Tax=Flexivirga aerilata TaxID=1656889 RepID=A0A849AT17_9MICO|nr:hypothetical protein [Flexivirga aerilata]NNG39872.1 hypothetical protein [Flexivirga aerilata]